MLIILIGCQASGGGAGDGEIISGHTPTAAKFTVTTTLNRTYKNTENIDFNFTFPSAVTVTGTPDIAFTVGASSKIATYLAGNGTTNLIFRYTVAPGDNDLDGITLSSAINLNGGSLKYNTTEDCSLSITPPNLSTVRVDTIAPSISSVSAPISGTYYLNQPVNFTVTFSEAVTITGSPRISIDVGGSTRYATYLSGSGTASAIFQYIVGNTDIDNNGVVVSSPLDLNGGSITDSALQVSALTFTVPNTSGVLIAGANPIITSVTPPANSTYTLSQNINFTLNFNKIVNVTGTPRLTLNIGGITKHATYLSGSGSAALVFRYTVVGGDLDADGIGLTNAVDLNGGTIRDASSNNALPGFIVPNLTNVRVLTSAPSIVSISLPGSIPPAGYDLGQNVDFTVNWSEAITSSGTSTRLKLTVGAATRYANYVSGSGTTAFVYRYTVGATDEDLNGLSIDTPLELNGSTLANGSAVVPALSFTSPNTSSILIDAVSPTIISNTVPAAGTYTTGQNLDFDVSFSEPVTISGTPRIVLDIGGSTRYATYLTGSGSSIVRFRYTIAGGDSDLNGIGLTATIDLNAGTIRDGLAHNAALVLPTTNTSSVNVDTTAPTISSVTPPANGSYSDGQNLDFIFNFSENVTVVGSPRVALTIGATTRYATYLSGSGTSAITFRHTVINGDSDNDGIAMTSPVDLNGGTIRDAASINANLTFTAPNTSAVLVSGSAPTISSVTPPANGEYTTGQNLDFSVTFSEPVIVTPTPRIAITLTSGTVYANYLSGGGTTTLIFRYTVQSGDVDTNGIALTSPIDINGGAIQDVSLSENAILSFTLPNTSSINIDGVDATIFSITPPANDNYTLTEQVNFVANFTAAVNVTGTPRIPITVGVQNLYATYVSGSGTAALTFRYTVGAGHEDTDGVALSSPVELNGGTIQDASGDNAILTFTPPFTSLILVDGIVPTISSVTGPAAATYYNDQNLDFVVNTSEITTVTGVPRITLTIGSSTKYATYLSGAGSTALTFRYTVTSGDLDTNGIVSSSPLDLNSGTFTDSAGNNVTPLTFVPPTTSSVNVDGTAAEVLGLTPPSDGTYVTGNQLNFVVQFSRPVNITGTPRIAITVGVSTYYATYVSGTGTTNITFRYTVGAGHSDADGITLNSPIQLNGGTIRDTSNVNATLIFSSPDTSAILIDGIDLIISTFNPPANGTYKLGDNLDFSVDFNYPATVTGTPRIELTIGGSTRYASYVSGSGTSTILFRYTVGAGEVDSDGIDTVGPAIQLNGGTVKDSFGGNGDLSFTATNYPTKFVDGLVPTISSVTGPANGTYYADENLDFTVNFAENINVSGSPRITLTVGSTTRYATYLSGSGSTALTFRHTVIANDVDANGIASSSPLDLNSGTLTDIAGNAVSPLTFTPPNTSGVIVDGTSASILSISPPANATYKTGNNVDFVANFSRPVTITGSPRIAMTVGGSTLYATYFSGSGTSNITFRYTVGAGDSDNNGIALTSPVDLNAGTIKDSSNVNATLTFTAPNTTAILVDGIDITISGITAPADKTYLLAEQMNFTVTTNYPATVTGTPRIELTVGSSTYYANYVSGSGSTSLVFRYTVAAGHLDTDGIQTVGPAIQLNSGTINDAFGDAADLSFTAAQYNNKKVDGIVPTISSITPPSNGTYYEDNNVDFVFNFSEDINVTGSPRITLTVGSTTKYATYLSGTGTSAITFRYTVVSGDSDNNGIVASSPIDLNSGTLKDLAGNDVTPLTFTPPTLTSVLVNGLGATIISVTPPANSTYKTTNNVDFSVLFSRAVDVVGTPRIAITIGSGTVYANYQSGSGTDTLTFRYSVAASHYDLDGIVLTTPIQLNGGTIKDSSLVNASLAFSVPSTTGILVDGLDVNISSITPPADATYKIGDALGFTVVYNYPAVVTGTPRIQITVGAATRYATYTGGSGTVNHTFSYTIASGDTDTDGITTVGPLDLNGGTVRDQFADNATLTFTGTNYPNKRVDGIRPTISSMGVSANKTYLAGETIDFTATYSENVTITGTPRLTLTVGATTRYATYVSGSGSTSIVFRYTVPVGDLDTNGIAAASVVDLNSGNIADAAGNAQTTLTFTPPTLTGVNVDGIVPTVSSITSPATYHGLASQMNFTVNWSEAVTVTGTPSLTVNIGGSPKSATYVSGSGTTALIFRYTTVLNDEDANGIDTVSPLVLSGGTLKDASGNNATLTFTGSNYATVQVDAAPPVVTTVTPPADAAYKSTAMNFTVTFNETVNITGTPQLQLAVGAQTRNATYISGSGTSSILFRYTPSGTDIDLDGIDFANSGNIDLNGGTIRDARLNNANLALGSVNMTGVYAVLTKMINWYDVNDSSHLTFNGSNVTVLQDKIGSYNYTYNVGAGVTYNASGFGVNNRASVSCNTTNYFQNTTSQTSPVAAVFVARAPSTGSTSQILFQANSSSRAQTVFSSTASSGTVEYGGYNGSKYTTAGGWNTAAATQTGMWSANAYIARGVSWSTTSSRSHILCQFSGQLAEWFQFNAQPTAAEMTAIESYINTKYGLSFP